MGRVLTIIMRAAIGLLALVCLSGCGGVYMGMADLSEATAAVQPIVAGPYTDQSGDAAQIALDEDGTYRVTNHLDEVMPARLYGPVSGLYVAQIAAPEGEDKGLFAYAILRISAEGIELADDAAEHMGSMLFDRLGVPRPQENYAVTALTDNARLNWALLQEFIVTYRDQLVFETLYKPAS